MKIRTKTPESKNVTKEISTECIPPPPPLLQLVLYFYNKLMEKMDIFFSQEVRFSYFLCQVKQDIYRKRRKKMCTQNGDDRPEQVGWVQCSTEKTWGCGCAYKKYYIIRIKKYIFYGSNRPPLLTTSQDTWQRIKCGLLHPNNNIIVNIASSWQSECLPRAK